MVADSARKFTTGRGRQAKTARLFRLKMILTISQTPSNIVIRIRVTTSPALLTLPDQPFLEK
jgi:hypothetical protein